MTHTLQCVDLSKQFGSVTALAHANLMVESGKLLALLGPSGGGKTTMLRLIAGFESPTNGKILINDQVVADSMTFIEPEVRRVGMVFQDYALFPHVNVADNVAFGLKRHQKSRVNDMLALVGLENIGERMPYELSGGQQQRVALARALAPQPDIVLLDEPFSNLDAALRAQVRSDVREILRQADTTAVFVTHDQEEAFSLADEVGVLIDGLIMQVADPQQLYRSPVNHAVAAFVGEANFLPGEAQGMTVDCALGQLPVKQTTHGRVDVLIRPEALHLAESDERDAAQITWCEFYGHDQRLGLRLIDGTELVARADSEQIFAPGQTVSVRVINPVHTLQP